MENRTVSHVEWLSNYRRMKRYFLYYYADVRFIHSSYICTDNFFQVLLIRCCNRL